MPLHKYRFVKNYWIMFHICSNFSETTPTLSIPCRINNCASAFNATLDKISKMFFTFFCSFCLCRVKGEQQNIPTRDQHVNICSGIPPIAEINLSCRVLYADMITDTFGSICALLFTTVFILTFRRHTHRWCTTAAVYLFPNAMD